MNMSLRRVCLVWQFWNSIFSAALCIIGIACLLSAKHSASVYSDCPTFAVLKPLLLTVLAISLINHGYMLTVDFLYTRTLAGTFLVQQGVLAIVLIVSTAIVAIIGADHTPESFLLLIFKPQPSRFTLLEDIGLLAVLLVACLTIGPFASLLCYFVSARRVKDSQAGWLVNTKELIAGQVTNEYPLILGVKRQDDIAQLIKLSVLTPARALGMCLWNMFFRRVPEVETMTWAFFFNTFALASIAALCVRASISLSLAQDRDCRLRTRVEECFDQTISCSNARFATMYGSSTPISDTYTLTIDIMKLHLNGTTQDSRSCSSTFTGPFKVFDCSEMCQMNSSDSIIAFNVVMRSLNTSALNINPTLKVWFSDVDPAIADISDINGRFAAPNLLSAWQLLPGYEWRADIGLRKRKFILTSFFRDVIAGNFPEYLTINLRPITTVSTMARTSPSIASGMIFPATQGSSAMMDADLDFSDARSYVGCDVIEEYRDSSAFDILGSIGGLLALVQGIYLWLFGRPLLWGLTGAKAISPFGLVGSVSRSSFRKKLRDHYQIPKPGSRESMTLQDYEERIRITTFLLDYVIDMGPASIPTHH